MQLCRIAGIAWNGQANHSDRSLHCELCLSLKKAIVLSIVVLVIEVTSHVCHSMDVLYSLMSRERILIIVILIVVILVIVISLLILQIEEEFPYIDDKFLLGGFSKRAMAMLLILLLLFLAASISLSCSLLLVLWSLWLWRLLLLLNWFWLLSWFWGQRLYRWRRLLLLGRCGLLLWDLFTSLITSDRDRFLIKWRGDWFKFWLDRGQWDRFWLFLLRGEPLGWLLLLRFRLIRS